MKKNRRALNRKIKSIQFVLILLAFLAGLDGFSSAKAQGAADLLVFHALSDGQFVYGPNIGSFDVQEYLADTAPHLLEYADGLYGRAEYFSINPKIPLTLLEICCGLISTPNADFTADPFGLPVKGLLPQIEAVSESMMQAFYLHLYSHSALPVSQRNLPSLFDMNGFEIPVAAQTNAGTYALMAGLALFEDRQGMEKILDPADPNGFLQTYGRLFVGDNPLDESNQISIPSEVNALAAPDSLLQLPYLQGLSWKFGGVHNTNGTSAFTDASSMDFYPIGSTWGIDTSSMWVVSAASGTLSTFPSAGSTCGVKVSHGGAVNTGWETTYYHLENVQRYSGAVSQNEKIGVIANTLAEATCVGGSATGPHVHFSLKYNGAYYPINGTALSGWYVHAGRYSYDVDPNYMWMERNAIKKYAYSDLLLSEAPPSPPSVVSVMRAGSSPSSAASVIFSVTFSENVSGVDTADFAVNAVGVSNAAVTGLSGSGSLYTVTVNTGNGNGTIRLDVVDNNSIVDAASSPLGGAAVGDGSFTSGEVYNIEKTTFTTDTWAVKLFPSASPDQLATQLGGQNLGQIGSLPNHYLIRVIGSASQSATTSSALASDPNVLWFEQQVARQQSKRGQSPIPLIEVTALSAQTADGQAAIEPEPLLVEDFETPRLEAVEVDSQPVEVLLPAPEIKTGSPKDTFHVSPARNAAAMVDPYQPFIPLTSAPQLEQSEAMPRQTEAAEAGGMIWLILAALAGICLGFAAWKVLGLLKSSE